MRRLTIPKCPYCKKKAILVTGEAIYPHRPDLADRKFWLCAPCDAYVGVHKNSARNCPLGRMANKATRNARKEAHAAFDPLWMGGSLERAEAYAWLASAIGVAQSDCHIGRFDEATCHAVVAACRTIGDTEKC